MAAIKMSAVDRVLDLVGDDDDLVTDALVALLDDAGGWSHDEDGVRADVVESTGAFWAVIATGDWWSSQHRRFGHADDAEAQVAAWLAARAA